MGVEIVNKKNGMAAVSVRLNPIGVLMLLMTVVLVIAYMSGFLRSPFSTQYVSLKELLCTSINVAKSGGARVKAVHESHNLQGEVKGKTKEGKDEMKTKGDMESHNAIKYAFLKAFPDVKLISEEHDEQRVDLSTVEPPSKYDAEVDGLITVDLSVPASDVTVWIDPLDATQEYTENLVEYVTVMVCVAVKGKPLIGVIHKPFTDETAWGWVDHGHSSNLGEVNTAAKKPYKVIRSRSHAGNVDEVIKKEIGTDTKIIEAGGAGFKTLEVIKGNANAYVHTTAIKKWDICAGNAVLDTVGGKMTTIGGEYIDYSDKGSPKNMLGLLATANDHEAFLKSLAKTAEELKANSKG